MHQDKHWQEIKEPLEANYSLVQHLGSGAFGEVYLIQQLSSGELYACKVVKKPPPGHTAAISQLQAEVDIMKKVKHPHIVELMETFETSKHHYLIMEYCTNPFAPLLTKQALSEAEIKDIIRILVDVIAYLHSIGIAHRDIKPDNIMLKDPTEDAPFNLKLLDFGLATFIDSWNIMDHTCGTPLYMAPEINSKTGYSSKCDIWSVGIMLYLSFCQYTKQMESELWKMIANSKITFPTEHFDHVSPAAISLLESMLKFDPALRITAGEILLHPWITGKKDNPNQTVIDLMKSYRAEQRLKRAMRTVLAVVYLQAPIRAKYGSCDLSDRFEDSFDSSSIRTGSVSSLGEKLTSSYGSGDVRFLSLSRALSVAKLKRSSSEYTKKVDVKSASKPFCPSPLHHGSDKTLPRTSSKLRFANDPSLRPRKVSQGHSIEPQISRKRLKRAMYAVLATVYLQAPIRAKYGSSDLYDRYDESIGSCSIKTIGSVSSIGEKLHSSYGSEDAKFLSLGRTSKLARASSEMTKKTDPKGIGKSSKSLCRTTLHHASDKTLADATSFIKLRCAMNAKTRSNSITPDRSSDTLKSTASDKSSDSLKSAASPIVRAQFIRESKLGINKKK